MRVSLGAITPEMWTRKTHIDHDLEVERPCDYSKDDQGAWIVINPKLDGGPGYRGQGPNREWGSKAVVPR